MCAGGPRGGQAVAGLCLHQLTRHPAAPGNSERAAPCVGRGRGVSVRTRTQDPGGAGKAQRGHSPARPSRGGGTKNIGSPGTANRPEAAKVGAHGAPDQRIFANRSFVTCRFRRNSLGTCSGSDSAARVRGIGKDRKRSSKAAQFPSISARRSTTVCAGLRLGRGARPAVRASSRTRPVE